MAEVSGVEFRDIASGKFSRVLATASPTNILTLDPSSKRRPCRAIVVAGNGTLQIRGIDDVTVTLPDMGAAWQWDQQASEIVGGTATNIVLIW